MKTIKVPLSIEGIKSLQSRIEEVKSGLVKASEEATLELALMAKSEIEKNYNETIYTDGNDDVEVFIETEGTKTKVGVRGSQVFYREYGTGTKGEQSMKPPTLPPSWQYNKGKTVRIATEKVEEKVGLSIGTPYWTYKDKSGNLVFTTGIPAGAEVYRARMKIQSMKRDIALKKVGGVLSQI